MTMMWKSCGDSHAPHTTSRVRVCVHRPSSTVTQPLFPRAEDPSTAPADKKKYMTEALKLIQAAEAIDNSNSDCHRWYVCASRWFLSFHPSSILCRHGIILSGYGQYQSSKEFIGNTFVMADHWKQAVTLNPTDASAHHLLGRCARAPVCLCVYVYLRVLSIPSVPSPVCLTVSVCVPFNVSCLFIYLSFCLVCLSACLRMCVCVCVFSNRVSI